MHLHVHTAFSMLDGAARLDDLFTEAARMGMPALAMTDHGNVFGAYEFWRKARGRDVHPHDAARGEHRGHAQPVPALVAGQPGGLLLQARMDRELLETPNGVTEQYR